MSFTTLKAELVEILLELEALAKLPPHVEAEMKSKGLLERLRDDKFAVALNAAPDLRKWVDKIVAQFVETYTAGIS